MDGPTYGQTKKWLLESHSKTHNQKNKVQNRNIIEIGLHHVKVSVKHAIAISLRQEINFFFLYENLVYKNI